VSSILPAVWAGVDVGGRRKGFHLALVDADRLRAGPARVSTVTEAVRWLKWRSPALVAVDSPRLPAPDGARSRPEERELARSICNIRYTPESARLARNRYYEWIVRGLALYAALEEAGLPAIECFPTASFTRWAGPRGRQTRSVWTREALAQTGLLGVPTPLGQDGRDAVAAALTARAHELGLTESFGPIVVPR
jgi:predicted nuclease with RNAse H fold